MVTCAVVAAAARTRDTGTFFSSAALKKAPGLLVAARSIVIVLQFALLTAAAMRAPLGWDGLFNQEFKARLAFEHQPQGQLPLAYFSDTSRAWSHPTYPLLVPFAEFWIYSWLGRIDQQMVKVLFPL